MPNAAMGHSSVSIVEQADIDSAVERIGALLHESVVMDNAEAFSAKEFEVQYKVVQRGSERPVLPS
ncbi:MAG: hypothetical protein J0I65_19555 [Variovorax sp.]|nr:hypothetical protein [Variovorax sp.]